MITEWWSAPSELGWWVTPAVKKTNTTVNYCCLQSVCHIWENHYSQNKLLREQTAVSSASELTECKLMKCISDSQTAQGQFCSSSFIFWKKLFFFENASWTNNEVMKTDWSFSWENWPAPPSVDLLQSVHRDMNWTVLMSLVTAAFQGACWVIDSVSALSVLLCVLPNE